MLNFIIPFIVLILVVVFIHEYGHYYFAEKYGVGVTDFSIGFGKEILEKYSEEEQKKLFTLKPLYQRALIVFGGPLANFLLAIVIFFSIYTFVGKDFTPAVINEVQKDSPAICAGLSFCTSSIIAGVKSLPINI